MRGIHSFGDAKSTLESHLLYVQLAGLPPYPVSRLSMAETGAVTAWAMVAEEVMPIDLRMGDELVTIDTDSEEDSMEMARRIR